MKLLFTYQTISNLSETTIPSNEQTAVSYEIINYAQDSDCLDRNNHLSTKQRLVQTKRLFHHNLI